MYKAIETVYSGYRFRSRLEARWAVFFDTLGVEYRYEPEGYKLDDLWYLPDFFLPKLDFWIEIKPDLPSHEEREKAIRLCLATQSNVALFAGDIQSTVQGYGFVTANDCTRESLLSTLANHSTPQTAHWLSTSECIVQTESGSLWGIDMESAYQWSEAARWGTCIECGAIGIFTCGVYPCKATCKGNYNYAHAELLEAYTAARQARFEHGSRGKS